MHASAATTQSLQKAKLQILLLPPLLLLLLLLLQDHSIRLWNIAAGCCVLLMRGPGAHAGEVFTLVSCCCCCCCCWWWSSKCVRIVAAFEAVRESCNAKPHMPWYT
jgi:hypothetical protein